MKKGLTAESFTDAFRQRHHWECQPGTRIANDLAEFAAEREGSTRDIDELYVIFCMAKGLAPYPKPKATASESGAA